MGRKKEKFHKTTSFTRMVPEGNTARGFEKFVRLGFIILLAGNLIGVILLHFGFFRHPDNYTHQENGGQGAPAKTDNGAIAGAKP